MWVRHNHTRVGWMSPTYRSWVSMRSRCQNPSAPGYKEWYGGKGIKVCKRWNDFVNFLADMGVRPAGHTLDRINSKGNYTPKNCRWATPKVQSMVNIKTRCIRGHYFAKTEYWNRRGDRCCKLCVRIRNRKWAKKRAKKR